MKATLKETSLTKDAKHVMVRLHPTIGKIYEQYCFDHSRKEGPQASHLILQAMLKDGYISRDDLRNATQS